MMQGQWLDRSGGKITGGRDTSGQQFRGKLLIPIRNTVCTDISGAHGKVTIPLLVSLPSQGSSRGWWHGFWNQRWGFILFILVMEDRQLQSSALQRMNGTRNWCAATSPFRITIWFGVYALGLLLWPIWAKGLSTKQSDAPSLNFRGSESWDKEQKCLSRWELSTSLFPTSSHLSLAPLAHCVCFHMGHNEEASKAFTPAYSSYNSLKAPPWPVHKAVRSHPEQFQYSPATWLPLCPPFSTWNGLKTQPPDLFIILGKEVNRMKLKCFQAHTILILFNRLSWHIYSWPVCLSIITKKYKLKF